MKYTKYQNVKTIVSLLQQMVPVLVLALENKNYQAAVKSLEECYVASNSILDLLKAENLGASMQALESYQAIISAIYLAMETKKALNVDKINEQLVLLLDNLDNSFTKECICEKKEIVFMPYKASMWDSLESVWQAACQDTKANVTVVSVPYFDKNPDGSFGQMQDEIDLYPSYVNIVKASEYNFESIQPDMIFIHNPYDEYNTVTSVDPRFYASNLKNYTNQLVYIPYFVLEEGISNVDSVSHFAKTPGVIHASKVIVQSSKIRKLYIEALIREFGVETSQIWEERIKDWGSPKFDAIHQINEQELDETWYKKIYAKDGTRKKIILYNTSLAALLQNPKAMLQKIIHVLDEFEKRKEDICLWWRPHPLMLSTLQSMHPYLAPMYQKIVDNYQTKNFGIYDDTADLNRAIASADAYYGDHSSLVELCELKGIPIMIQDAYCM